MPRYRPQQRPIFTQGGFAAKVFRLLGIQGSADPTYKHAQARRSGKDSGAVRRRRKAQKRARRVMFGLIER